MMKILKFQNALLLAFITILVLCIGTEKVSAQSKVHHYMRIAKIVVDSAQLESYKSALTEGMHAAFQKEKGVLGFNAVYDKKNPTHITIFETYADTSAYKLHILTPHFKKYKTTVAGMVKALELVDVEPISQESKLK